MLSARLWPLSERLWPIKPPPDSVRLWVNMLELEPFLLCPLVDAISSLSATSSRPSASFLPRSLNYGSAGDIFERVAWNQTDNSLVRLLLDFILHLLEFPLMDFAEFRSTKVSILRLKFPRILRYNFGCDYFYGTIYKYFLRILFIVYIYTVYIYSITCHLPRYKKFIYNLYCIKIVFFFYGNTKKGHRLFDYHCVCY